MKEIIAVTAITLMFSLVSLPVQADPVSDIIDGLDDMNSAGCEIYGRTEWLPWDYDYRYEDYPEQGCHVYELWVRINPNPGPNGEYQYYHSRTTTPPINCDPSC